MAYLLREEMLMAKWEYLRIEIKSQGKGFTDYQWVVERADGKDIGRNESTIRGTKYPDLDEYLAQIGSEG